MIGTDTISADPWRVLVHSLTIRPSPCSETHKLSRSAAAVQRNLSRGEINRMKVFDCVSHGEYTIKQVAARCDISESCAKRQLNDLCLLGDITKRRFSNGATLWKAKE